MSELLAGILLGTLAGATVPLGAFLARIERIRPDWLEQEARHSVIAFGGGVLVGAVALVLVPKGAEALPVGWTLAAFLSGGLAFFLLDRLIEGRGGSVAQLLAMLMDFLPESLALGAMLATDRATGLLLALLIGLQNLPESFNAYREVRTGGRFGSGSLIGIFAGIGLLGPVLAWGGYVFLRDLPDVLGAILLFAAGGILYLTFQDLAPQARLERHWAPPLGAVAGFALGLFGHLLLS